VYRFPVCKFVEFEASDETWCKPLGIGRPHKEIVELTGEGVLIPTDGGFDFKYIPRSGVLL